MEQIEGIKKGSETISLDEFNRYIDKRLEDEDFLDGLDILARKEEPAYPLEEVVARENKRRGLESFVKK
jgi:hypothetical protein